MLSGASRWVLIALVGCAGLGAHAAEKVRVAVDPGHGGKGQGATGPGGVEEGAVCLDIAKRLSAALEKTAGAEVVLTREEDVVLPLPDRVAKANAAKVDVFISIHANSMPTRRLRARASGIETYFLSLSASGDLARRTAERENAEGGQAGPLQSADPLGTILTDLARTEAHNDSSRLAYAVHQAVIAATSAQDRGVQQAPFFVLNGVEAPAILIEVGFISHPEEAKRLQDAQYQQKLAQAIADGVKAFLAQAKDRAPVTRNSPR